MRKLLVLVVLLALAIPLSASAATTVTYTSGFQLQNLSNATANVVIDFYNPDGTQPANSTVNDTIAANGSKTYYPLPGVTDGFNGSAVVSSDQQLASITNVLGNGGQRGAAYGGFTSGATTVSLPLITKAFAGIDTWFNVQNTGSGSATVTVAYAPGSCTETATIAPNASATFNQANNTCLAAGFVGGATITSNQAVVAVVMEVNASALLAYSGFNSTATNPVFPLVSSNYYYSGTGIAIQNTGGSSTDVTISYTPSGGSFPGNACSETKTVSAGQTTLFSYPQLPAACGQTGVTGVTDSVNGGFVGSAIVTTNSATMPLAGIVNSVIRDGKGGTLATADAYNGVDPASATSKVSMPLIMDRNYKIFTGFSVVNVGTNATSVSCTFSNTSYAIPATNLAAGQALTSVQLNAISSGYVGGGVCTATGGDAKIVGIVNELTQGAPSTTDALLIYPAFNY